MQQFTFKDTDIDGLKLINLHVNEDQRGYFLKSFEKDIFELAGIEPGVTEINESLSKKGVLRGLHAQKYCPQSKLVRVVLGEIYDVAVDIRANSSTYGKWQGFYLSEHNKDMLFIPKGFAHGFLTLSNEALVTYVCEGKYLPDDEVGILWNDAELSIKWPIDINCQIVLSEKDLRNKCLREALEE